MRTWLTADWRIGEPVPARCGRPFANAEAMLSIYLRRHNERVAPDDRVIVVGDAVSRDCDPAVLQAAFAAVRAFHGVKTLVRGEHDALYPDEWFAPAFERIVAEGDGIELEAELPAAGGAAAGERLPLYAVHHPTRGRWDRFNLTGHVLGAWKYQLNSLNVGVDVHFGCPVALDEVPAHYRAVCETLDADVWAAYHTNNERFRGTRGTSVGL